MFKILKRLFVMILVIVFCVLSVGSATADTVEDTLKANMKKVYKKALSLAGVSDFDGWCGNCTGYQLLAAGVFAKIKATDGNASYKLYKSAKPESGLSVTAFPGKYQNGSYTIKQILNILNEINLHGENTYAAFCFDTGWGDDGKKFGHVLLVHAVYNGQVYWGESFGTTTRVDSIADFASYYAEDANGQKRFDGAVVFGYEELKARQYTSLDDTPRIAKSVKDSTAADTCRLQSMPYDQEKYYTGKLEKGTIVYLQGAVKNSHGNTWYETEDGKFIYSGDLEILVEDASYTETKFGAVGISKNDECWLKDKPFEKAAPEKVGVAKGKTVEIVAKVTNSYGNIWYKTADGKYIYSGDLKVYEASYTKLFDITADFTNTERRKSHLTPYQDSPAVDSYSKGEVVSVTRFVTNSYGNIWAQLKDGSYLCFYDLKADETKMTYKSSKFKVTGVEGPTGDRKTGTACNLTGKITSTVPILTMTGYVENRETGAKTVPAVVVKMKNGTTTANINSTSNTVDKVNLNNELVFQKIKNAGHYCYKVTLQLGFTDTKSGKTFKLGGEQAVISMNFTAGNPPAMKEKVVRGDVNDDGKINLTDLLQLLRHINNSSVAVNKSNADMNGDGKVALIDLLLLLRKIND